MTKRDLRVLALGKYGELAASSRQRMVQYRAPLASAGIALTFEPLLGDAYVKAIADERGSGLRVLLAGYVQRLRRLLSPGDFDVIWVQSDLLPYVPGVLETAMLPREIPVVYDCDDAVFHGYDSHKSPIVRRLLGGKMRPLLRRAKAATCGNDYLRAYVGRYCANSVVVPTVVDTQVYRSRAGGAADGARPPIVGWIGSASTWSYVTPLAPILRDLVSKNSIAVRVVGAGARSKTVDAFTFVDWTLDGEVDEIGRFDIGIMPLTDDLWSRGKCGYKLIQYMACGLPVIASPVGVNAKIVQHGENGFLASTEQEWRAALETLAGNRDLRARMGAAGRALAVKKYSLASQGPLVVDVLRAAAGLAPAFPQRASASA